MIGVSIAPGESVFTRMLRSLAPLPSRSERTYGDFGGCVGSVLRQSFQMQTGRSELNGPTIPRQRERLLYSEIDTTCIYTERLVEMGWSCIEREPALDKTVTGHNNIDPAFSFLSHKVYRDLQNLRRRPALRSRAGRSGPSPCQVRFGGVP